MLCQRMDFQLDHVLYFTVLSAFLCCTGENEDFYVLTGKSHPHERNIKWFVFLLIIFLCLFCSFCYCSETLSLPQAAARAQQFFIADSGTTCIVGPVECSRRVLWPDGLLQCVSVVRGLSSATWQMIFFFLLLWLARDFSLCLHQCWWDLWLFVTSWIRSFVNDVPKKKVILMLIPSGSKCSVPGM